ncbi:hypothetical protein BLNAU_18092 [Blattamonas nauphoetae]|uniref:Uncharacterized protein n=1 Tax=Blattamonas nauphoetae TaxID=2049346 RepID=A0ABQ9X9Q9_9EUKA|nr:hypothetical protein BLNAU_18092 [Blattamonas nauphoetae]
MFLQRRASCLYFEPRLEWLRVRHQLRRLGSLLRLSHRSQTTRVVSVVALAWISLALLHSFFRPSTCTYDHPTQLVFGASSTKTTRSYKTSFQLRHAVCVGLIIVHSVVFELYEFNVLFWSPRHTTHSRIS